MKDECGWLGRQMGHQWTRWRVTVDLWPCSQFDFSASQSLALLQLRALLPLLVLWLCVLQLCDLQLCVFQNWSLCFSRCRRSLDSLFSYTLRVSTSEYQC